MIKKIAVMFGIVFIVFTGLAALINYEFDKVAYSSSIPASFIEYSMFTAMLPFLLAAVLSFVLAALSSREAKSAAEKEPKTQKTETQETEDVFKETPT